MPMPTSVPPPEPPPTRSAAADLAVCRARLGNGSRTFLAASLLLPRAVRDPACALYAFCREADDAVDNHGAAGGAVLALHRRLDAVYAGTAQATAVDRAFGDVVRRYAIPRALPAALIEGFEWDAEGRRYETLDELHGYAARVAGTVGVMMALLMGVRSSAALARACDLGVAMQLSNIARDVGEDARMGRLYLPQRWLREAGIDPDAWLARPRHTPALGSVVARLLAAADALYARVDAGVAELPLAMRPGINAARFLYAAIGHEVARRGLDSVQQRAVVGRARKAGLLFAALLACRPSGAHRVAPALPAAQFLIDAVTLRPGPAVAPERPPVGRVVWLIDLFDRLERHERSELRAGMR